MVKGTSRTVIEINDTGNKMIERIVLFVKPEYGNLNAARLKKEADIITDSLIEERLDNTLIRERYIAKKRRKVLCVVFGVAVLAVITAIVIF